MEFNLNQWRDHHESEQQHPSSAKIAKHQEQQQQQHQHASSVSALPLFVPEQPTSKLSSLSALPDSTTHTFINRMGGSCFSIAQRQELELQALIFKYMLAGAAVPPELLHPIKKSLIHSHPYFLQHYQPSLFQSGYWTRGGAMDPEPGRCRRTDGKKWRCSRDVVAGKKYCERHVHRGGKNRSRKPVEIPTPTTACAGVGVGVGGTLKLDASVTSCNFDLSRASPSSEGLIKFNHSYAESKDEDKGLFESKNELNKKSSYHMLRPFFDDWPQPLQQPNNAGREDYDTATCLSISMPANSSSDLSFETSYW